MLFHLLTVHHLPWQQVAMDILIGGRKHSIYWQWIIILATLTQIQLRLPAYQVTVVFHAEKLITDKRPK